MTQDEQQVKTLQHSITQNNQAIASLQQQMQQRDQDAQRQIQQLSAQVSKVQTPAQAVAAIPSVTNIAPNSSTDGSVAFPAADAVPLFPQLADDKSCRIELQTCSGDLADQKQINTTQAATVTDQTKQLALKDDEVKALKKPKSFWKRVGHDLKVAAIAVGVALLLY